MRQKNLANYRDLDIKKDACSTYACIQGMFRPITICTDIDIWLLRLVIYLNYALITIKARLKYTSIILQA